MSWQPFSLHFKQTYEGGYRYLDRCGELMIEAIDRLDFLPGETKVTGARLEMPEKGILATVDTSEVTLGQDLPDDEGIFFLERCQQLMALVVKHFAPRRIQKNGFALKLFWPLRSPDAVLEASLRLGDKFPFELGKALGMIPSRKRLDYNFTSGSMDFHVLIQPITFEKVTLHRHNPNFNASPEQQKRVQRLNINAERWRGDFSHAVMMELDLVEFDPPEQSSQRHFDELKQKAALLTKQFPIA